MSNLVCKNCKSISVEYEDYCGGTSYYRCKTCGQWGDKDKFTQQTVFHSITQSEKTLAEKLVYYDSKFHVFYSTLDRLAIGYQSEPEAIAATLEKLKEVEK